ncbi:MAG: hypothetical protein RL213_1850 [Bacteroidota bacterium]
MVFQGCRKLLVSTGDADCILNPDGPSLNSEYCQSRGLYRSTDNGRTWDGPIGSWFDVSGRLLPDFWKYPSLKVCRKLVAVPGSRRMLLALVYTCDPRKRTFDATVFRSDDAGRSWQAVLEVPDGCFRDLVFSSDRTETVYVGGRTVFRSMDSGKTWESMQRFGLPPDSLVSRCELAVSGAARGRLYVLVALRSGKVSQLYMKEPFEDTLRLAATGPASPEWRTALAVEHADGDMIYFSAGNKVNRFQKNGQSRSAVFAGAGLHDDVHELTASPDEKCVYASTDGGLGVTTDGGKSWKLLYDGLNVSECWGVAMCADTQRLCILAGLQDAGTIQLEFPAAEILKSSNGDPSSPGAFKWEIVRGGDGMKPAIHPLSSGLKYTTDGNNNLNFRWDRVTNSWQPLRLPAGRQAEYLRPFVTDPMDTAILYTGYDDLFRSSDGGRSWAPLGIPKVRPEQKIIAVCVSPSDTRIIYAAFSQPAWSDSVFGKLFRTSDGGKTWEDISIGLRGAAWNSLTSITVHPQDPYRIVAGFRGGWSVKAMQSERGGEAGSWRDISAGLPGSGDVNALCFDPVRTDDLYAATHEGVWRKTSDAAWADFNGNMPWVFTSDLSIDSGGRFLLAGTHGAGVWISGITPNGR